MAIDGDVGAVPRKVYETDANLPKYVISKLPDNGEDVSKATDNGLDTADETAHCCRKHRQTPQQIVQ